MLAALAVAGCGYQPALRRGSAGSALIGRVEVAAPDGLDAFNLVVRLEERLGRAEAAEYRLDHRIETRETGIAIDPSNATTRYNVNGAVSFTLLRLADGAEVAAGRVEGFTAYSTTGTTVAEATARRDAYARLMRLLADQIVTRLLAESAGWDAP